MWLQAIIFINSLVNSTSFYSSENSYVVQIFFSFCNRKYTRFVLIFVVVVIVDCSTDSWANFIKVTSFESYCYQRKKNLSFIWKTLSCRQWIWLQPVVIHKNRRTRLFWYQFILAKSNLIQCGFIINLS